MLRIGNYNLNNYNIRNNKNIQSQPAFKAITARDAFEIGIKHNLPDHRAQQLIDMVSWINSKGVPHFLKNNRRIQEEGHEMKPAVDELIKKAQSSK